jgi:uncharacterized membrane protein
MIFLYIGPGLGGGVIAVIAGIFLTFISFLVAVFWLPLKRFVRYLKSKFKRT